MAIYTAVPNMTHQSKHPTCSQATVHEPQQSRLVSSGGDQLALHTPLFRQYLTLKAEHPGALLVFRMGDFYELFFEDARKAARLLSITLTRRGESSGAPVPMAGVPYHAIHACVDELVQAGEVVVICERKAAEMSGSGKGAVSQPIYAVTIIRSPSPPSG